MLYLSRLLIANQEIETFDQLKIAVREAARQGEIFLRFDVKPPYPDTPSDWEDQLEASFCGRN